jgi:ribonucleoside-diphosphate reductase alpha chain
MGVHEWLLLRGYQYEITDELKKWLKIYEEESDNSAVFFANKHGLSVPVKRRAIAPNGTIGIIGETTTSAEPIFCVAYKRRFLDHGQKWRYQYVIDPTANRLIEEFGVDPEKIEDATTLSYNVEKRIKFQADLQEFIDHAISSTINLPYPITDPDEVRDFGEILMKYLPRLRGITCYPSGARAGQPMESVPYAVAHGKTGVTLEEDRDAACASGVCGV